jgi:hypothetical protein
VTQKQGRFRCLYWGGCECRTLGRLCQADRGGFVPQNTPFSERKRTTLARVCHIALVHEATSGHPRRCSRNDDISPSCGGACRSRNPGYSGLGHIRVLRPSLNWAGLTRCMPCPRPISAASVPRLRHVSAPYSGARRRTRTCSAVGLEFRP